MAFVMKRNVILGSLRNLEGEKTGERRQGLMPVGCSAGQGKNPGPAGQVQGRAACTLVR